jgi:hypothetical protein
VKLSGTEEVDEDRCRLRVPEARVLDCDRWGIQLVTRQGEFGRTTTRVPAERTVVIS